MSMTLTVVVELGFCIFVECGGGWCLGGWFLVVDGRCFSWVRSMPSRPLAGWVRKVREVRMWSRRDLRLDMLNVRQTIVANDGDLKSVVGMQIELVRFGGLRWR